MSRVGDRTKIVAGLLLCMFAVFLMQQLAPVLALQSATSAEQFATRAYEGGNALRWSSLVDSLLYVPGYLILFWGILGRYDHPVAGWARTLLLGGAIADQIENLSLQLGMGRVDLDAGGSEGVVAPAGWLITVLRIAGGFKWLLLGLGALGVVAVVIRASRERVKQISAERA